MSNEGLKNGLLNEKRLIEAIDGKSYFEMEANERRIISTMFKNDDQHEIYKAEKCDPRGKPDMVVSNSKGEKHYVSIKTNSSIIMHKEEIKKTVLFFRSKGISKRTQKIILLFQYGDGTCDGTGKKRLGFKELLPKMIDLLDEANEELNRDKKLVWEVVERVVFKGNFQDLPEAEFLYHGDVDYGIIISKEDVKKHVMRKDFSNIRTLHVGPLQLRPYARYQDFSDPYPEKRHQVNYKWANLIPDIEYINMQKYNSAEYYKKL